LTKVSYEVPIFIGAASALGLKSISFSLIVTFPARNSPLGPKSNIPSLPKVTPLAVLILFGSNAHPPISPPVARKLSVSIV